MSVEVRLFKAFSGFSNIPRVPTEADRLINQFKVDSSSNNSSIVFSGIIDSFDITIIANGEFENILPGMTFESLQPFNTNSFLSSQDVYVNGQLWETNNFTSPISVKLAAGITLSELSTLYAGNDVVYAPNIKARESGIDFFGYAGNDRFYAYGSHEYDDVFHGGDGIDSVIYSSSISNFNITASNNIWDPTTQVAESVGYFIRDNSGRDGDVQVTGVERLVFSDAAVAFDVFGTAGKAYRIYEAVLGRAPDLEGLGYWINDMDNGVSLTTIAQGFIASAEFTRKYGANPSYDTYINLLYQNILGRAPDAEGLKYWVSNMQKGIDSPAVVLASFSEGFENKANVAPDIAGGIFYTPWIS